MTFGRKKTGKGSEEMEGNEREHEQESREDTREREDIQKVAKEKIEKSLKIGKNKSINSKHNNIENCCDVQCLGTVSTCATLVIPKGFQPADEPPFVELAANTDCLRCIVEPCLIPATGTNPCSQQTIDGFIKVNKVSVVGCITFLADVLVSGNVLTNSQGVATVCTSGTVCVDQVICISEEENPCPNLAETNGNVQIRETTVNECGETVITLAIDFTFPPCQPFPC